MLTAERTEINPTEVRPIEHRTNRTDTADRLVKQSGLGRVIYDRVKEDWPTSRYVLEHPNFDVEFDKCRFEVNVARRKGEEDRISITIRFPKDFPLQTSEYPVDLEKRTISGSEKRVIEDGHLVKLMILAQAGTP